MKQRTAQTFIQRAVNKAECIDIFEILVCIRFINRSNASQRVENDFKISADMRKAILRYSDMKSHETMIDQENISISDMSADKRLIRSIIERVAHIHEHVQSERKIDEISKVMQSNKFLLTHVNENKRLIICLWIIERLEADDIFIFNDELYHEIKEKNKRKIFIIKNDDFHEFACNHSILDAIFNNAIKCNFKRWNDRYTSFVKYWKQKKREECDLKLQEANRISKQKIDEKRQKALISETIEFKTLQKMNIAIDAQNAKLSK